MCSLETTPIVKISLPEGRGTGLDYERCRGRCRKSAHSSEIQGTVDMSLG